MPEAEKSKTVGTLFFAMALSSSVNKVDTLCFAVDPSFLTLIFVFVAAPALDFPLVFPPSLRESPKDLCSSSENRKDLLPAPAALDPTPVLPLLCGPAFPFTAAEDLPRGMSSTPSGAEPDINPAFPVATTTADLGEPERGETDRRDCSSIDRGNGGCATVRPSSEGATDSALAVSVDGGRGGE